MTPAPEFPAPEFPAPEFPVLEFNHITKDYRPFWGRGLRRALDGFSLSVGRGEIFGFLGPNGAGKTTAIHIALGFMRPSGGSGRLLGTPFGTPSARRRVGFLAENVAFFHRPAQQILRFYGQLNGVTDPELKERTRDLLDQVDLTGDADRNIANFSRGMLQRLGLAQALINNPDLVILDEPASALDPAARVKVRELLLHLKVLGKTVFLSSHLLSEIEHVCDRVAILKRGRVIRLATISELLQTGGGFAIKVKNVSPEAMVAAGFPPEAAPMDRMDGSSILRVDVPAESQRRIIETVWQLGGEILSVTPLQNTLEKIFLELTGEEEKK